MTELPQQPFCRISETLARSTNCLVTSSERRRSNEIVVDKFTFMIEEQTSESLPSAMVKLSHPDCPGNGFEMFASFLDSASSLSLIPLSFLNQLRSRNIIQLSLTRALQDPVDLILGDDKSILTVREVTPLYVEYEGSAHVIAFCTIPDGNRLILSNGAIWRLKCTMLPPNRLDVSEAPKCLTYVCVRPNESASFVSVSDNVFPVTVSKVSVQDDASGLVPVQDVCVTGKVDLDWVQKQNYPEGICKLVIRHPALEVAMANPKHRRCTKKSRNYNLILTLRLRELAERGVCERTTLNNLVFTSQLCLVDKRQTGSKPRVWDPKNPNLHSDIRLVMNSAAANKMIFLRNKSGEIFLTSPSETQDELKSPYTEMYQTTAIESLRLIPAKVKMYYAKVDLKNGFESIEIAEGIRRFYGAEVFDEIDQQWIYYRWKTIVQGNKWSSVYFRLAVHMVISEVIADSRIQGYIATGDIVYFFLQDDIGMGGTDLELCALALNVLLEYLKQVSLTVNPKKLVYPCESIVFCGYTIGSQGVLPTPTRNPITKDFAEQAWAKFCDIKLQNKALKWLKSIAGAFQFFSGFLIAEQYLCLRKFYDMITVLQKDVNRQPTEAEKEVIKQALYDLSDYVLNRLPALTLANFPFEDIICSFIIVDANADAWSGILFRMVRIKEATPEYAIQNLEEFKPVIHSLRERKLVEIPDRFMLVPAQLAGEAWHDPVDLRRSSTMRERISQFQVVEKMLPLLKGPIFVVSDCRNAGWDPKDFSEQLSGTLIPKWQRYNQEVQDTIWLPRSSLPSVADCVARIYAQQHKNTVRNEVSEDSQDTSDPQLKKVEEEASLRRQETQA